MQNQEIRQLILQANFGQKVIAIFPTFLIGIFPAANKRWQAYPGTHHCSAIFDEALAVIEERMGL